MKTRQNLRSNPKKTQSVTNKITKKSKSKAKIQGKRKRKSKDKPVQVVTTEATEAVNPQEDMLEEMRSLGFDGQHFVEHLQVKCYDMKRRGKPPRRVRYIQYCSWAHSLMMHKLVPEGSECAFPSKVLAYIRHIVPGNIKGEIREDATTIGMSAFCTALEMDKIG